MTTNFLTFLKSKPKAISLDNKPTTSLSTEPEATSLDENPTVLPSAEPKRIYNIRLILSNGENDATYFKYSCEGCFRTLNTFDTLVYLPGDEKRAEKDFTTYKEAFEVFKQLDQRFVDNFYRNTFRHFELATFFIQRVIVNDPNNSFKDEYSVLIKSSFKPLTFEERIKAAPELILDKDEQHD